VPPARRRLGSPAVPTVSEGSRCNAALDSKRRLSPTALCPPALGSGGRLRTEGSYHREERERSIDICGSWAGRRMERRKRRS